MKKKTIHTKEDVQGVLFIIEYIKQEHFPTYSSITDEQFDIIVNQIKEDYHRKVGKSSLVRLFNIRSNPHPTSYKILDNIVCWCFDHRYDSFKDFLEVEQGKISSAGLIEQEELDSIVVSLNNSKALTQKNIKIELADMPVSINLGEGFIKKLIDEVALITGDLLQNPSKDESIEIIHFGDQRVRQRVRLREQRWKNNSENIIAKAIEFARASEASDEPVDTDWVADFFDIAQDCSNEKMQYLWAKLLAGEVENPGSFSRRTMQRIKVMTQYEALIFEYISKCLWLFKDEYNGDEMVVILDDHHYADHYFDETFEFDGSDINNLENLGLLKLSYVELTKDEHYSLSFFGKEHVIGTNISKYDFSFAALTPSGEEIVSLIGAKPNKEYYKKSLEFFKKRNILIK